MIEQGTPEWHAQRLGKATASRIADILAKTAGGAISRSRANYEAELICERLTGQPTEHFQSFDMKRGTEIEPEARANYAFMRGVTPELAGFVDHPTIAMSGASPDSYVGDDGLLELKVVKPATQLDTLLSGKIDGGYQLQMQWQLAVTGRAWVDFCSYSPLLPAHLQLFIKRVPRDPERIKEVEAEVVAFLKGLDIKLARLAQLDRAAA